MSDNTGIEWTDATWNPVRGCSLVSDGCKNCYAMHVASRFNGPGLPYEGLTVRTTQGPKWSGKVMLVPDALDQPLRWKKPRKIFVNSMSDLFHDDVPDSFIDKVFDVMMLSRRRSWRHNAWHWEDGHTFQILTKRPERMLSYVRARLAKNQAHADRFKSCPTVEMQNSPAAVAARDDAAQIPPHIWLGTSVEDQSTANQRIPVVIQIPASVIWLSLEPLLGPVDLLATPAGDILCRCDGCMKMTPGTRIAWVVVGGESGRNARPMHIEWARILRDQCSAAGVPFLFKQWGEYSLHQVEKNGGLNPSMPMTLKGIKRWESEHRQFMAPSVDATAAAVFKPGSVLAVPVGKKFAGRLLDGVEWNGYPESAA